MKINFTDMLLIALFIEAVISAIKPLWNGGDGKLSVAEIVSMCLGVVIAVTCKLNLLNGLVRMEMPVAVRYIFYVLTGVALGRGPSFLYDFWESLKGFGTIELNNIVEHTYDPDEDDETE